MFPIAHDHILGVRIREVFYINYFSVPFLIGLKNLTHRVSRNDSSAMNESLPVIRLNGRLFDV